jgi:hypothetical protein
MLLSTVLLYTVFVHDTLELLMWVSFNKLFEGIFKTLLSVMSPRYTLLLFT